MKSSLITASALTAFFCAGALAEEKREADAHQHGHGALNVALEGETLSIEMETPGADILGFEHMAKATEDKATVEKARKTLADPVSLFGLSAAAGCSVTDAEIEIGADGDEHHDEDEHHDDEEHAEKDDHDAHDEDHAEKDEHDHEDEHEHGDDHADEEESHSEVHAHYMLTCTAPAEIAGLDLTAFFEAFPNAEELDAAILTEDGQASGEITPASPMLTF